MKIEDAKLIPIEMLVEKLGGRYSHTDRKGDLWYFSPFRPDEKTASFKISIKTNRWHDFGISNTFAHHKQGNGGDILDLWSDYHLKERRASVAEALEAIANLHAIQPLTIPKRERQAVVIEKPRYEIYNISPSITFAGLKDELVKRRISLKLANEYLKQGHILDTLTGNRYTGFLFENDLGGYEASIPNPSRGECFKMCIGKKAITRIMATDDRNSADVFEGFWDMLSWLEFKSKLRPINHTYILNSTSLVGEACEKITSYSDTIKYAFLFMDNDEAGYIATHTIAGHLEDHEIQTASMEQFYTGFKDLNEFWASRPKLS